MTSIEEAEVAKGDDIQERLIMLGVNIMEVSDDLPRTVAGRHIAAQILRSGTSGGPNYAEGRGAESGSDFIHKLGIVLKELNETEMWLEMIQLRGLLPLQRVSPVRQECSELCRIIAVSRRTARERTKR
jgi:four helix bundle protein